MFAAALVELDRADDQFSVDVLAVSGGDRLPTEAIDPWLGPDGSALVDSVQRAERDERAAQARGLVALADLARSVWARERASSGCVDPDFMGVLVASSLGLGPRQAASRLDDALALTERLPRTLAALAGGWLSMPAAHTVVVETVHVDEARVDLVEADIFDRLSRPVLPEVPAAELLGQRAVFDLEALEVLDPGLAGQLASVASPARLAQLARRAVASEDADAVRARRARSAADRDVRVWAAEPGTSWVGALLPDASAAVVYDRVDGLARVLRAGAADREDRTLAQLRADAFVDLMLGASSDGDPGPVINLDVHLAADGDVSIDHVGSSGPEALTDLLALAGRQGSKGRARLRLPRAAACPGDHEASTPGPRFAGQDLAAAVVGRDVTCRFPGCAVPAIDCDLDHVIPHPAGPTCLCNLIALCRRHHRVKTFAPGWRVINIWGQLFWISPSGRTSVTRPEVRGSPHSRAP